MADSFGWGIKPFHQLIDSLHGGELIALRMVDGHAETVSDPFCVLLWVPYTVFLSPGGIWGLRSEHN